ncbi:dTDP-4-dehydrorhamnose reductase [Nostoc sp. CHAB 5824]|nr:dTDP-4-dehydrorhamnose reductase [Nostoc sp. CHAB 5824]
MTIVAPILVTGGSGQVGGALVRIARERGIEVEAPGRDKLDMTDSRSIVSAFENARWSAVINCAAYTAVDRAESEAELAHMINAVAPGILARSAQRHGIPIVQVSTDYVFDGSKSVPYTETDPVNPLGIYGRTKEAGEAAVRSSNTKHAIIRTAWVLSADGQNFMNTMIRLGAAKSELSVVNDQIGCPSSAIDIAEALLQVTANFPDVGGTWHFTNSGQATWFDLAAHIFEAMARRGMSTPVLQPISTAQYPTPAKRPENSRLSTKAIQTDFNIRPRAWREAIDEILVQRLGEKG